MTHKFAHTRQDRPGNTWEIHLDDSVLATGRRVVFTNGKRWVGCSSEDEARDERKARCDE